MQTSRFGNISLPPGDTQWAIRLFRRMPIARGVPIPARAESSLPNIRLIRLPTNGYELLKG